MNEPTVAERMLVKFQELETRRRLHVDGLDLAVQAIAELRAVDRHLVDIGLHDALVLEHIHPEDPPLEELPEFRAEPMDVQIEIKGNDLSDTPPPDPVSGSETVPAAATTTRHPTNRRFSEEEKAGAVRLADELGSDVKAAKECGTTATSISNWRKAGHGKKMKTVSSTAPKHQAATPAHEGPKTKCSICRAKVPLLGEVNEVSRLNALREHYKDSPECQDAIRKRHA